MFSGIVEATSEVLSTVPRSDVLEVQIARPASFSDLKTGDSICVNGVCLTIEKLSNESMQFAVGPETLRVTHWTGSSLKARPVNLERSLRYGDRVHGHFVSGHADFVARVQTASLREETMELTIEIPEPYLGFFWSKGSIAINGVSLTVNHLFGHLLSVWLIPETLRRTNLGNLAVGDSVIIEIDTLARALKRATDQNGLKYSEDRI